jgi:hypothetical protein
MVIVDEEALRSSHPEEGRGQPRRPSNDFLTLTAPKSIENQTMRKLNGHHVSIPQAPMSGSFRLPIKIHDVQNLKEAPPRLLHP